MAVGNGTGMTRRKYPRLDVLGRIEGQVLALDAVLTLRELSLGGFSADSSRPFAPCLQHTFRFSTAEGLVVDLDAVAVHCRIAAVHTDSGLSYIAGFEWADPAASRDAIAQLVEVLSPELARR